MAAHNRPSVFFAASLCQQVVQKAQDRFPAEPCERLPQLFPGLHLCAAQRLVVPVIAERFLDAAPVDLIPPGDAFGVDTQQYVHTVPRPLGNLCRFYSPVQPCRETRMPEVVRMPGKG
jgi:hypothetical protein